MTDRPTVPEVIETPDLITLAIETAGDRAHDAGECGGYPSCDICYRVQCEEDAAEDARERTRAARDEWLAGHCCGCGLQHGCRCPDDGPDQDGGAR